jgi:hypothetical protein
MKTVFSNRFHAIAVVTVAAVLAFAALFMPARAADRECPLTVDLKHVNVQIDSISYAEEVPGMDGNSMKLNDEQRAKYRAAVVTLKITKPAGAKLTLAAADLTLHYYNSEGPEVTVCEGLSFFSTAKDMDRPIKLPRQSGPGFVKQTTGPAATQATTLYVDAVFGLIESDISDAWIAVGQPTTAAPYATTGWKKPPEK